jgi:hypothetical protein
VRIKNTLLIKMKPKLRMGEDVLNPTSPQLHDLSITTTWSSKPSLSIRGGGLW